MDLCQDRGIQTTGPLLGILLDYFTDDAGGGGVGWGGISLKSLACHMTTHL